MTKNKKIMFGLSFVAAAIVMMFFTTMPSAGSKEVSIEELLKSEEYVDKYMLTEGLLKKDSVQWDADKIELKFDIFEKGKEVYLPVHYKGIKPDNFSDDVIVIVEGYLNKDGVFEAEKVMTKCPSKYEGKDPELHKQATENTQD